MPDTIQAVPADLLTECRKALNGEAESSAVVELLTAELDLHLAAAEVIDRFAVIEVPHTFGGDDALAFFVVDRNGREGLDGVVVARSDYRDARKIAACANADPERWDAPFDDTEPF